MNKYWKQFWIVVVVAAVLLLASAFLRAGNKEGALERGLRETWGLELPGSYTVEYRAASEKNLEKDGGLRYHALLYDDNTVLDNWLPWEKINGESSLIGLLDELNTPGGERPDLQNTGLWQAIDADGAEVFLLHEEGDFRLYILEYFH